jgi:fumarate reductase subunit D
MKLIERYLQAIAMWLPKEQKDDILAELSEAIHARIEDRETELGRALNKDEVAAVLREYGPPVVVAGRYLPQRHLIGPAFFPIYAFVLKLVVLWILVPAFVLIVGPVMIATSTHHIGATVAAIWTLGMAAVFATGIITIVFALIERYDQSVLYRWSPSRLPRVARKKSPAFEAFTLRCTGVFEAVWGILVSVGWVYVCWYRAGFDFNSVHLELAPIWRTLFVPILLLLVAGIPVGWITAHDPSRRRLRSGLRVILDAYTIGMAVILALAGTLVQVTGASISASDLGQANQWTNTGAQITMGCVAIGAFIDGAIEVRRLCVQARTSAAPVPLHQ